MTAANHSLVGHTHAEVTTRLSDPEVPVLRLDAWTDGDHGLHTNQTQTTLHLSRFGQEELRELVRSLELAADMIAEVMIDAISPEEIREAYLSAEGDRIHDAQVEAQLTEED
jgi:hypothetical protein